MSYINNEVVVVHPIGNPISQFENLSKKVSTSSKKSGLSMHEKPRMSPREEIYKSMIREIRHGDAAQMNSLVHKASGILRFGHYKKVNNARKVMVSWDIDGRRILTYEDMSGNEMSMLQRQTNFDRKTKKGLLASLNEPIFGLDSHSLKTLSEYVGQSKTGKNDATCGELPKTVSKVWEDYIETGDASKLWHSKEDILAKENQTPSSSSLTATVKRVSGSSSSIAGSKSAVTANDDGDARPQWKTFYKAPTPEHIVSSSFKSVSSLPSMPTSRRAGQKKSSKLQHKKTQSSFTIQDKAKDKEKSPRIQHVCVVNGSLVAFNNFGFENFTNWFGDELTLEANQQRSQPKFHRELDFTTVKNRDIKIRLLDGCKLEVVGRRRVPSTSKLARMKEIVLIPEGYRTEDLIICRTKLGKLVVEEVTPEPLPARTASSKLQSSKSRAKWKISRKL